MDVRLVVQNGRTRTREVRVDRPEIVVGRAHGCSLRIASSEVSRRHCILRVRGATVTVEDLDSSNGTFLNGREVRGRQQVTPGDQLRVGPVTFVVAFTPPKPADTPPVVDHLERVSDMLEDGEDIPVVAALQGDEDSPSASDDRIPLSPLADDEPIPVGEVLDSRQPAGRTEEEYLPVIDADEVLEPAGRLDMPEGDLRDLLVGLDDSSEERPRKKKK